MAKRRSRRWQPLMPVLFVAGAVVIAVGILVALLAGVGLPETSR